MKADFSGCFLPWALCSVLERPFPFGPHNTPVKQVLLWLAPLEGSELRLGLGTEGRGGDGCAKVKHWDWSPACCLQMSSCPSRSGHCPSRFLLLVILWDSHLETIDSPLNHPLLFPWNDLNSLPKAAGWGWEWGWGVSEAGFLALRLQWTWPGPGLPAAELGANEDAQNGGLETDPPKGSAKRENTC